ncbi:MAG: amino acid transport protein [Deltaproteobacteria bacterium]|nr:MAG: amino acid transport protein [Deltaproteobacteria bacterium]
MLDPAYLVVSLIVSGIGFVMFMYGKKQHRPVQLGSGLLLLLLPFFVRDGLWLGVASAVVCAIVWGSVKAGL